MRTFKRPNVLLLYTDQQRFDTISYGRELAIDTPNLNALAADGAYFTNYFVNNPVCSPSRMSFLSGRHCSSVGVGWNGISLPEDVQPLNCLLKPYGYHSAQIGKLHFTPHAKRDHKDPTPTFGFDTFILSDEPGCYDDAYTKWLEMVAPDQVDKARTALPPAALRYNKPAYSTQPRATHQPYLFAGEEGCNHASFVASELIRYINSRDGNNPFFAIGGFYAPHPPINPLKKYVDMVDVSKLSPPKLGENEWFDKQVADVPEEKWLEIKAYYLAQVKEIDCLVGEIVQTLKDKGLYDDTIIVFTSDHGEYLGEHGKIGKGMPGYDCITHVPMIMKYTREIKPGTVIDNLVEGVDFVPTILDFCGIQVPQFVQGKSLRPLLRGETTEHKDSVLVESFEPYGLRQTTLRTAKYKYYCSNAGDELFFDLEKDPGELENRVNDPAYKEAVSEMRYKLVIRLQNSAFRNMEMSAEY